MLREQKERIAYKKLCLAVYKQALQDAFCFKQTQNNQKTKTNRRNGRPLKNGKAVSQRLQEEATVFLSAFSDSIYGLYLDYDNEQVLADIKKIKTLKQK